MDIEKTFVKVPRAKIRDSLNSRKVNSKLIRVSKHMYKLIRNYIINNAMKLKVLFTTKKGYDKEEV